MNYNKIGNFIALKRKEKGLTQKDLALKIGVTDKAVSKWERGLGCPDVSLLEMLSYELDVSILEILKGRSITNEVIKVTEANDYVTEGLNYSSLRIKNIISKLLFMLTILLGSLIIILNIFHMIDLNRYEEYNFSDNQIINKINDSINKIEENIKVIKNNQGIFYDEDYDDLTKNLDIVLNNYKNFSFLKLSGIQKIKASDLYLMDLDLISQIEITKGYRILVKYSNKVEKYLSFYNSTIMAINYMKNNLSYNMFNIHQYKIPNFISTNTIDDNNEINSWIMYFNYLVNSYLYYTEQIIEVGEFYE